MSFISRLFSSRIPLLFAGLFVAVLMVEPALAGQNGGAEFKAATDDITAAGEGYGGLLIALLGGVVGLITGIATGQVRSALSGLLWAFIPALVLGVITAKYAAFI